mmetsp:Transcript_2721/g.5676  ORF Transcript_2721/g.5676 Transcript_2721/m.5676 type:complete len:108 (+) Transcript_2721:782-1105(+)
MSHRKNNNRHNSSNNPTLCCTKARRLEPDFPRWNKRGLRVDAEEHQRQRHAYYALRRHRSRSPPSFPNHAWISERRCCLPSSILTSECYFRFSEAFILHVEPFSFNP